MLQQIRISAPSMCLTGNQISANQMEQIQCLKRVTWDFFFFLTRAHRDGI